MKLTREMRTALGQAAPSTSGPGMKKRFHAALKHFKLLFVELKTLTRQMIKNSRGEKSYLIRIQCDKWAEDTDELDVDAVIRVS